ncbi:Pectinesterase [Actinidia chinensis var. chinensis]|uniref:Pectinesterase n=1 Tax=Actinidia chinensis var. chinensis TaxID=1590841 RepID=A0A2R6R310_ACTCC|nr:Pectinesterase [Actinidia chinensis var. chinensis]
MGQGKRRITVISISSLVLVAMVVAVTIGVSQNTSGLNHSRQEVTTSTKAIKNLCEPTDYKQVCVESLTRSAGNTTDPKELIRVVFQVAKEKIQEAARNSTLLQKLHNNPRTKEALGNCGDLAEAASNDLERSFDQMGQIDASKFDDLLANLKTWLSGAITYQETCLDGFENTTGDAGEKMKEYLRTGMQLTSNGLAIVTEISAALSSMNIEGFNNRRLLSHELPILGHDEFPTWVDAGKRKLLAAGATTFKPDLIVAKDGTGKYKTINEALKDIPLNSNKTFVLYIKEGVYQEKVQFNRTMTHLMVVGDGPTKTKITGGLNFIDGVTTFHTATVVVLGDFFIAKDIGFENSAGPEKHQAVALRVGADMSIFYNCQMDGYQDTLYAHTYRQFYRDCVITGTIDFIFGDSAAVFQGCTLVVRKPLDNQANIVTAQGRKDNRQPTGIVLQNCTITADPAYYPVRNQIKSYLGRPWKEYSRTIIMESFIDDLIQPEGWMPWNGTFGLDTCFYTEYNNRGPSASKANRAHWKGVKKVTKARMERFTASQFIMGGTWIPVTGVPYTPGFIFPPPTNSSNAPTAVPPPVPQAVTPSTAPPPVTQAVTPSTVPPPVPQTAAPAPSRTSSNSKRGFLGIFF